MAKLTKTFIVNYVLPVNKERVDLYDSELKGFGIRISRNKKSFFVMKYNGKQRVRVTIGDYPVFTADIARKKAIDHMRDLSNGINPNEQKKESRIKGITLEELYKQYLEDKTLKASTQRTNKDLMTNHLGDWLKKPVGQLTPQMIIQKHKELTENAGVHSANNAMRLLRAQLNYWKFVSGGKFADNPVEALSSTKSWNKTQRRKTYIASHQLPAWHEAVNALENPAMRDYLLLTLFTGLRKKEGLSIKWENVDLNNKSFTVQDTKNGRDHTLPMSKYLETLFKTRQKESGSDKFVFPGEGKSGYMAEPKRAVMSVRTASNTTFCIHDLRRTYISIASELVPFPILKNLANHSEGKDVTEGYIVITLEKLREPMEKISRHILQLVNSTSNLPPE